MAGLSDSDALRIKYFGGVAEMLEFYREMWDMVSMEEKIRVAVLAYHKGGMSEGRFATLLGVDLAIARRILAEVEDQDPCRD